MTAPVQPADAGTGTPTTDPAASTPPASTDTPPTPPSGAPQGDENPWSDPDKAKAEIERLRRENASQRTRAKENAAAEARAELAEQVGRALGLVTDDEPVDPAKLTEQLTASQSDAKAARVENAILRAALTPDANVDPLALLDSVSFRAKVVQIDPTDTAAITAAISEAVTDNPRLARSQAPGGMRPNPAQGSSASQPLGLKERIAQAEREGDTRTAMRLKAAQAIENSQA